MSTIILTELYGQLSLSFHGESSSERQKQIYQDILDYIKTNISKPLRISEIARELGFSDNHNFSRTYKKLTWLSPSEYRNTFSKRLLYHV